jgi:hypothetical protein
MSDIKVRICLKYTAFVDVHSIFGWEGRICNLPRSDTATTATEKQFRRLYPQRSKSVQEVCLPGNGALIEISTTKFANVKLSEVNALIIIKNQAAYCILITKEAAVIEPSIRVSHAHGQGRPTAVRGKINDEIEVVCSEVNIAERGIWQDAEASRSAPCQRGIEIWRNCKSGRIRIVIRPSNRSPNDVHGIQGLIFGVTCLTEEINGA